MAELQLIPTGPDRSFWQRVGGRETFERLVRAFYAGVAEDPVLRPMYEEDLEPAIQRLTGFLEQYWGGPTTYSEERGHPRLRMRHLPFRVNPGRPRSLADAHGRRGRLAGRRGTPRAPRPRRALGTTSSARRTR